MKILFLGQIVGKYGIQLIKNHLDEIKKSHTPDFIIAAADATTNGYGLGKNHAFYLRKLGINLLVGGEAIFSKRDLVSELSHLNFVLRPANFGGIGSFGHGVKTIYTSEGKALTVINLMGQMGLTRINATSPYNSINKILSSSKDPSIPTLITYGAIASAEKQTLGHFLAGRCSAVVGYGAKALTHDAQIISHTGYITDSGRIAARFSVGGLNPQQEIERLRSQRPRRSLEPLDVKELELQATLITLNDQGQTIEIKAIRAFYPITSLESLTE